MTDKHGIIANSKVGDKVQLTDVISEIEVSRGCLCCPQPSLTNRKIPNCFTRMPKVKDTGDYEANVLIGQTTARKEIFSRLCYHSDVIKVHPDYEMPYLTWSFCEKQQMQPTSDVTMKHKDQVLHAKDVLVFAKMMSANKYTMRYLARWRHREGWLSVLSRKKNTTSKDVIDMELRCFSKTRDRPFFLQISQAFQTPSAYYLVAPYSGWCTLRHVVMTRGEQTVNYVMFYVMELIHALIYLHENDIILRNLNPDTVMLDQEGHTFISDFSLAIVSDTSVAKRNNVTVPLFNLAPEVIKHDHYTKSMDWWSLGSVIYYLLYGQEPFRESNSFKTVTAILTRHPIFMYKTYGFQLISFCRALLRKSRERRLGSGTNGSLSVVDHSCLRLVDWGKVARRKFAPPFVPPEELNLSNGSGDLKEIQTPSESSLTDEMMCSGDTTAFNKKLTYLPFGEDVIKSKGHCSETSTAAHTAVNLRRQYVVAAELSEVKELQQQQKARRASNVHDPSMFEQPPSGSVRGLGKNVKGCEIKSGAGDEKMKAVRVDSQTKRPMDVTKCTSGDAFKGQLKDANRSNAGRCCQHEKGDGSERCPWRSNLHSRCFLHIFFDKAPNGEPRERLVYGNQNFDCHADVGDENNSGDFVGAERQTDDVVEVANQSHGAASVPGTHGDSESTEQIAESRDESHDSRIPPNDCSLASHSLSKIAHPDTDSVSTGPPHLFPSNKSLSQLEGLESTLAGRQIDNMTRTPTVSESSTHVRTSPKINHNLQNDASNGVYPDDRQLPREMSSLPSYHNICDLKMPDIFELKLAADSRSCSNERGQIVCNQHNLCLAKEPECVPKLKPTPQYKCDNEFQKRTVENAYIGTKSTKSRSEESNNTTSFKRETRNSVDRLKPKADSGDVKINLDSTKKSVKFNSLPSLAFCRPQSLEGSPGSFLGYVTSRLEDQCTDKAFSRFCQKNSSLSQRARYPVRAESFQLKSLFQNTVARKLDPNKSQTDAQSLSQEHVGIRTGQFKIATLDGVKKDMEPQSPGKVSFWKRLVMQVKNRDVVRRGKSSCENECAEASAKTPNAKNKNRFPFFRTPRRLNRLDSPKTSPVFKTPLSVELLNTKLGNNHTPSETDSGGSVCILSECMPIQTSLAANIIIDVPISCKGIHSSYNMEDSKLSFSDEGHCVDSDHSSDIPSRSQKDTSGQFSCVETNDNLDTKQVQNITKEKSTRNCCDNVDVNRSMMYDVDTCPFDNPMESECGYPQNELFISTGVNGTPNLKSTIEGDIHIDTNGPIFASLSEVSENIEETECGAKNNQEAVSHVEDILEKGVDTDSIENINGLKERSTTKSMSCEDQYNSDLKEKPNQFEKDDDTVHIEINSQQDRDDCMMIVKELIDALLTDVMSQTRHTDSIDDFSANVTSESTSFVTADTTANGTSKSTSEFFTADLTSESKVDSASEIAADGCQSFCDSNNPVALELIGKCEDVAVLNHKCCLQVNEEIGQSLYANLIERDSLGVPTGEKICEQLSGLETAQEVNMSSDDKANRGNEAVKAAEVENKRPIEQLEIGGDSSSPSESENIKEVTSAKVKEPSPNSTYVVDSNEHGDECLSNKEAHLLLTDVKTVFDSSGNEVYCGRDGASIEALDAWHLPPAYQQRNMPPLPLTSILLAENIHSPSRSAELAVSHGEEGPSTPSSRARQLMHALDEITPYSEFDAWRYRPVRIRPDNGFLSPREAHEDAESRDRGSVDDDMQVIGSLTIESLEPPVKGLIYRRKAK